VETFRVGCMGQLGAQGMAGAVKAVGEVLEAMGIETAVKA
jgi:2-aminoethylphosphonate-pyruvate transaminase